ncbi:unnamed protein product, partial [Symbiodinium pilosum]
ILEVKKLHFQRLDPERVCPDGQTRIPMVHWMFRHAPEQPFSPIRREDVEVLVESSGYFVCIAPANAAKRIRRSECELVFDHSNLFVKEPWYSSMSPHKWCEQVGVGKEDTEAYLQAIENNITGVAPNSFTLAAVSKLDGNVVGYVHCTRRTKELSIGHLKVDWEHQSRGVGGMLIAAGEKSAQERGWSFENTCLAVLKKNYQARSCYCKDGFRQTSESQGNFPTEGGDPERWHTMSRGAKRAADSDSGVPTRKLRRRD